MRARSGPTTRCRAPQRPPGAPHHPASSRIARVARASARRRDRFGVAGRAGAAAAYGRGCRSRSALSPPPRPIGSYLPRQAARSGLRASAPRPRGGLPARARRCRSSVRARCCCGSGRTALIRRAVGPGPCPAPPDARNAGPGRLRAVPGRCVSVQVRPHADAEPGAWAAMWIRRLGRLVDPVGAFRPDCLRAPARPVAVAGADDRAPRSGGRNAPGNSPLRGRRRLRAPERVPLRFPADPVRLSRSDPLRFGSARVDGPDRPGPGSWIGRGMPCAKAGRRAAVPVRTPRRSHALCQGRSQGGGEALVLPGLRTSSVRVSGTCSGGTAGMCRPGAPPGRGNETPNGWCRTERRQARPEMSGDPEWIRCRIRDRLSVRGPVRDPFPAHPLPVRRPSPASLGSRRTVQHGVRRRVG